MRPELRTAQWSVHAGRLSIVVRNEGTRVINSARAIITARDARGSAVAIASAPATSPCCSVVALSPHHEAGLYYDLGPSANRIRTVSVAYADVSMTALRSQPPAVSIGDVSLQTNTAGTVIRAGLALGSASPADVVAQAVLRGPGGNLVSVVATRIACLGQERRIVRLAANVRVPPGTILGAVTAAVPPGAARCQPR